MYLVLRCPGCSTFMYVDRFQQWKLCPVCSEAVEVRKAPVYLEVEDYSSAEHIVAQLEEFLHRKRRRDLTGEEKELLRAKYTEWVRSRT